MGRGLAVLLGGTLAAACAAVPAAGVDLHRLWFVELMDRIEGEVNRQ